MASPLEEQFNMAMFDVYRRAKKEANYSANLFLQMLTTRGRADTARHLIDLTKVSEGYTALYERGRLDLTLEAVIVENQKWHPLFTAEQLKKAHVRLAAYGYVPETHVCPP